MLFGYHRHTAALALGLGAAVTSLAGSAAAANGGDKPVYASQDLAMQAALTPRERGQLAKQFVLKWGEYTQRVYGVPVRTWSNRMVATFVAADAANLRDALLRDSYEGAIATLHGTGHQLSDAKVIDRIARIDDGQGSHTTARLGLKALGDLGRDLVYTPVQPCRILDTRNTQSGAITAGGTRNFIALNALSFADQGGSNTDCGTFGVTATAVAINLTVVTPDRGGYATVYPYGTTRPLSSSVNYTTGAVVNNGIVAQIPNPLGAFDFTVYSYAGADYVADIVGYFAPPRATALQCQQTAAVSASIAAGASGSVTPATCASGYTSAAVNCNANGMALTQSGADQCAARNDGGQSATLSGTRTCCRVPGR